MNMQENRDMGGRSVSFHSEQMVSCSGLKTAAR